MQGALGLVFLLAAGSTYDVGLSAEVRRPATIYGQTPTLESEVDPALLLRTGPGEWQATIGYDPRVVVDTGDGTTSATLQREHAVLAWSVDRLNRLQLEEHAFYGTDPISVLAPPGIPNQPIERIAALSAPLIVDAGAALGWTSTLSRRFDCSTLLTYSLTGGANAEARGLLPLQHVSAGRANLAYRATTTTTLSLSADGTFSSIGPGQSSVLAGLAGTWRTLLDRGLTAEAQGGVDFTHSTVAGSGPDALLPVGSVAMTVALPERASPGAFSLGAAITTALDPLTARPYERAEGKASLNLRLQPGVQLSLSAAAGRAFGALAGNVAQTEVSCSLAVTHDTVLLAGARAADVSTTLSLGEPPGLQWTAFVGLRFLERGTF